MCFCLSLTECQEMSAWSAEWQKSLKNSTDTILSLKISTQPNLYVVILSGPQDGSLLSFMPEVLPLGNGPTAALVLLLLKRVSVPIQ